MPKYIDFDALGVQSCNPDVFVNKGYAEGWNSLIKILYNAPAADVEPVRHGRWIPINRINPVWSQFGIKQHKCSECGCEEESARKRCPECGAKMGKEIDDV